MTFWITFHHINGNNVGNLLPDIAPGLVDVELGAEMVENVVGWGVETTSGGEVEVGGHEEIGEVLGVDLAGDGGVVASGARVFEDGARVGGVDPDELHCGGWDWLCRSR
jgi:hypothetical protein